MEPIYEVSQINLYIQSMFEQNSFLENIAIRGELSNYKVYPSGHHYFTLKDSEGGMRAVMFKGQANRLRFKPQSGMKVIVTGRITVFPRDGAYQMYCNTMTPDGVGDLHMAYEQLKEKLQQEGLFSPQYKQKIPKFPHKIAIITSSAGAAVHDMLRVLSKRYPLAEVVLLPVRVQGVEAPAEIVSALHFANQWNIADVIIAGRGGGSIEDLWAFNDEQVARAIFASKIPVISAVGHEPDVTIADFVADLRAATPSNGAELVAPDQMELRLQLDELQQRMAAAVEKKLKLYRQRLDGLGSRRVLQSPMYYVIDRQNTLNAQEKHLYAAMVAVLERKKRRFIGLASGLDAMSPLKVLGRGYSLVKSEDQLVKSVAQVTVGAEISVSLSDGTVSATVTGRNEYA